MQTIKQQFHCDECGICRLVCPQYLTTVLCCAFVSFYCSSATNLFHVICNWKSWRSRELFSLQEVWYASTLTYTWLLNFLCIMLKDVIKMSSSSFISASPVIKMKYFIFSTLFWCINFYFSAYCWCILFTLLYDAHCTYAFII